MRLVPLAVLALAAWPALGTARAADCPRPRPTPRELFRDAAAVHEGIALSESFEFEIYMTWRGEAVEALRLLYPRKHLDDCSGQRAVEPGFAYLLVLSCDEAYPDGVTYACRARTEPIEESDDRVRFLEHGQALGGPELAAELAAWARGELGTAGLADWLGEMDVVADVEDWLEVYAGEGSEPGTWLSATARALRLLAAFFGELALCTEAAPGREAAFRGEHLPVLAAVLDSNAAATPEGLLYLTQFEAFVFDRAPACEARLAEAAAVP